ncbi:hypothetical protein HYE69_09020 [Staphylococcus sp. GSSP0090]|nr:hypothetical protein [Staphylococcus sp. GSSP0090]
MNTIYIVNLPHIRRTAEELTQHQTLDAYYKEGLAVSNYLNQFHPEVLFIELDKSDEQTFVENLKENKPPSYFTEFHFAAIPLSLLRNINIHLIDDNHKEQRKMLQNKAEMTLKINNPATYEQMTHFKIQHNQKKNNNESMLSSLLNQSKEVIPLEQYFYALMQAEDIGLQFINHWSQRNYKMAMNTIEKAKNYKCSMLFVGKSHSRYLKFIFESTGLFNVIII